MNKIKLLPQDVISKIAAGEVIERPVYAVKELVENSIDAGADSIIVALEESGLKRITVIDNGAGMSAEDVGESVKPHATSKLDTVDALATIRTLGFRGEALSSIAAISKLTVQSRRKEDSGGTSVVVNDGKVIKASAVGMPKGTQVIVENLFHSVPARKKFLKSQRTEFRHSLEVITHFAFMHPQIHFVLTHNGKTILDLPKTEDAFNRIQVLLGKDVHSSLLPVTYSDDYISVTGYLARPQMTTTTPHKQYLFVNSRSVGDKGISMAVKAAFGTLIEKGSYPICILFFSMPHEVVDVNVHPRKEEVRFVNQSQLYETVARAVSQTLTKHELVFYFEDEQFKFSTDSYVGKVLRDQSLPWTLSQPLKIEEENVMQMHNLYLVAQTKSGLVLIDQHAAHERIRYEQLLEAFQKQKKKDDQYTFPKPKVVEVSLAEKELLEEHEELFARLGFAIEPFKGTSFLLRSVPSLLRDRDYKTLVSEILEDLRFNTKGLEIDSISRKIIAYLACHGAVKAGDALTKKQSLELIKELEKTPNNTTCPHGRPTKVMVDLQMINKMFKR